jgi:hypothetical protein
MIIIEADFHIKRNSEFGNEVMRRYDETRALIYFLCCFCLGVLHLLLTTIYQRHGSRQIMLMICSYKVPDPGLRLAQPGGPTHRVSAPFFLPEDGRRIQLLKRCSFIYDLDDGQSPRKQFCRL